MQEQKRYSIIAHNFTDALKLKGVDRVLAGTTAVQSSSKLIYQLSEESYFFIYRFGSVVFFNADEATQKDVLGRLNNFLGAVSETQTSEQFHVQIEPGAKNTVGFETAVLDELTLDKLDILALVLAQSAALEYFEIKVDEMLKEIKDIGRDLKKKGRLKRRSGSIKKFIGSCITTKENLVATLYLLDKPDETWNDELLDNLYREARDMFEIKDRYKTLDYKLRMVQENLELIADLLQHRNANLLEWAIIILILFEIVLFLVDIYG